MKTDQGWAARRKDKCQWNNNTINGQLKQKTLRM